jgi:hypothetical protein
MTITSAFMLLLDRETIDQLSLESLSHRGGKNNPCKSFNVGELYDILSIQENLG